MTDTLHTLPSGRQVELKPGTGRDLVEAMRVSGKNQNELGLALAARLVRIDAKPVLYEDFMDWPLADVMETVNLATALMGNAPSPGAST